MGLGSLVGIKKAITNLNPEQVRVLSERPVRVAICASGPVSRQSIENFLLGDLQGERRRQSSSLLRDGYEAGHVPFDLAISSADAPAPSQSYVYVPGREDLLLRHVLKDRAELGVALARWFPPFRKHYVQTVIHKTCKENTLFSLATALPDVVPSLIELPWAVAEFASDTAFLTANQLKMAFLIAAASDREIGYREQKSEIATVIAGAFGWRAIARQIVGKIPFGGGLIAKAAVAYAGTRVVGLSLERLYSLGYTYTRQERDTLYRDALVQGKRVAERLLTYLRPNFKRAVSSS